MLLAGSLLALLSGLANATAAALEKREGMRVGRGRSGIRLLSALARRPLWLLAILLSVGAWTGEAASLALAPVPAVATLRNAGRGLLVVAGGKWLEERFSRLEVTGVVLATAGGVLTAVGAAHARIVRRPLSNFTELLVALACLCGALLVSQLPGFLSRRSAGRSELQQARATQAAGVAMGIAVGLLFSGTGVFTKEVGDRFALYGFGGVPRLATSAGLWLMLAMAVWSQSLLQQGFQRANAASVSAANASVAALGLIAAGFVLYDEAFPSGADAVLLVAGIVVSLLGTGLLVSAGQRSPRPAAAAPVAP